MGTDLLRGWDLYHGDNVLTNRRTKLLITLIIHTDFLSGRPDGFV